MNQSVQSQQMRAVQNDRYASVCYPILEKSQVSLITIPQNQQLISETISSMISSDLTPLFNEDTSGQGILEP